MNEKAVSDVKSDPRFNWTDETEFTLPNLFNHGWSQLIGAWTMMGLGVLIAIGQQMINQLFQGVKSGKFVDPKAAITIAATGTLNASSSIGFHLDDTNRGRFVGVLVTSASNVLANLASREIKW